MNDVTAGEVGLAESAFKNAEYHRVTTGDFEMAIAYYQNALARLPKYTNRQLQFNCWHGLMICCIRLRKHDMAEIACREAQNLCQSNNERAALLRDLGDALTNQGLFEEADNALLRSIQLLNAHDQAAEYFISVGYRGRVRLAQGRLEDAFNYLEIADRNLHWLNQPFWQTGDRKPALGNCYSELYNVLCFASCLSQMHWKKSQVSRKEILDRADILAQNFGSPAHRLRVVALRYGGFRADQFAQRHRVGLNRLLKLMHDAWSGLQNLQPVGTIVTT